jgi:hypothetical protein
MFLFYDPQVIWSFPRGHQHSTFFYQTHAKNMGLAILHRQYETLVTVAIKISDQNAADQNFRRGYQFSYYLSILAVEDDIFS